MQFVPQLSVTLQRDLLAGLLPTYSDGHVHWLYWNISYNLKIRFPCLLSCGLACIIFVSSVAFENYNTRFHILNKSLWLTRRLNGWQCGLWILFPAGPMTDWHINIIKVVHGKIYLKVWASKNASIYLVLFCYSRLRWTTNITWDVISIIIITGWKTSTDRFYNDTTERSGPPVTDRFFLSTKYS